MLLLCLAGPAAAENCPPAPDHSAKISDLVAKVRAAETEAAAKRISNRMWELWTDAPDDYAQELLNEGMTRRESYDYAGALDAFDALVAYCPDYAEGYNQRAFINFIRQDYAAALPDLERALARNPRHTGALTGKALSLVALERPAEAIVALRRALDLNPWLTERHLLPVLEAQEKSL